MNLLQIRNLVRHIENVQQNCLILGERLIEAGEEELGYNLIANGYCHDNSKFSGIESDALHQDNVDPVVLELAVKHHNRTNKHHPEAWSGGIKTMPRVFLAEMVCDWKARSNEFGTSLVDWINEEATKRFGFDKNDKVYEEIMYFVNIVCDKPFQAVEEKEKPKRKKKEKVTT